MRTVLDLAGVTDVVTKIHTRSKNKLTIARATVEALKKLRTNSFPTMQLNTISPRVKTHKPEPVGRGGKRGKTSGRGGGSQTARART